MAITKQQKVQILGELKEALDGAQAVTFVSFTGLGVDETTILRKELRENGVGYRVAKKTLLRRVLDAGSAEGDIPALEGNIAVAWSDDDLTAPARGIYDFRKGGREDNLAIVGGIFEGRYMDAAEMNEIATIPGMQTLRGMFVNVINAPIQGFVSVLGQIAEKKA